MPRRPRFLDPAPMIINTPRSEPDLVRLIILRALCTVGCSVLFIGEDGFEQNGIAQLLGLDDLIEDYNRQQALFRIKALHQKAECNAEEAWRLAPSLRANISCLQQLVGLSELESRLLVFLTLMHSDSILSTVCNHWLDELSLQASFSVLASLLDVDKQAVASVFASQGKLLRCGLVELQPGYSHSLLYRFELLSSGFTDRLLGEAASVEDFLLGMVKRGKSPALVPQDYSHVQQQYQVLQHYLQAALLQRKKGVNVLIYGAPGTGKSELARLMAQSLGAELLEVCSEDEQGESLVGKTRLRVFKAAQQFFANQRTLILFDEIQDVFDDGGFFGRSTAQLRKAEINTLLEENPLPTFWLSNDVTSMDNAFIRRFDIVIELAVPPMRRRLEILQVQLSELPIPAASVKQFAKHEHLSPAVVSRAASVVRTINSQLSAEEVPRVLETLFNGTLVAQGFSVVPKLEASSLPSVYDPTLVNADVNLAQLMQGIAAHPSARICLYGPPGTGKSAFAQWLAEQLQRPLHNRKLSDILSQWVGGTEKNLQRVFCEAEQENAVLLLDEVDSFLRDRREAKASWEVTQVNEMLVQMEAYNGVFIASTNLLDNLDQAALRRFDLKIKLDYLQPKQARSLFIAYCAAMGLRKPSAVLLAELDLMTSLTPGDFAAVQRRNRFHPLKNARDLLLGLREECAVKAELPSRRIGFV